MQLLFHPQPDLVLECMGHLGFFLHEQRPDLPLLIKAGLVHVQFETIHPFLDGNGRLGRLLITFLLVAEEVIREPILYLSLYFKTHRSVYYDLLDRVRAKGDWEAWLDFFLSGIKETADQAASAARRIIALLEQHQRQIDDLGRPAASVLRVFQHLQRNPSSPFRERPGKLACPPPPSRDHSSTCAAWEFYARPRAVSGAGYSCTKPISRFSTKEQNPFGDLLLTLVRVRSSLPQG